MVYGDGDYCEQYQQQKDKNQRQPMSTEKKTSRNVQDYSKLYLVSYVTSYMQVWYILINI